MAKSIKKPSQKIIQRGVYNIIKTAPTRSGKGISGIFIPTILYYPDGLDWVKFIEKGCKGSYKPHKEAHNG
jgi:hypothetical protein